MRVLVLYWNNICQQINKKVSLKMSKEKETAEEKQVIETVDDEGNLVKFELFDIVEFKEKEYALLLPVDSAEEDDEIVLMRLTKDGEDYLFEAIETDEEFDEVSDYIENLVDEDEE